MNKFLLERLYYKPTYTIGRLSFKGNYICDTQGCILPGWNWQKGMACSSKSSLDIIMSLF